MKLTPRCLSTQTGDKCIDRFSIFLIDGTKAEARVRLIHARGEVCRERILKAPVMVPRSEDRRVGSWLRVVTRILIVSQLLLELA